MLNPHQRVISLSPGHKPREMGSITAPPKKRMHVAPGSAAVDEFGVAANVMPVNRTNPLPELRTAIAYYAEKTGKRVTLEAALMAGKNTGKESAERMIQFAQGIDVNINLIPWNSVEGLPFTEPSAAEVRNFTDILKNAGLNVTLRTKRGRTIGGACGQLGKTLVDSVQKSGL